MLNTVLGIARSICYSYNTGTRDVEYIALKHEGVSPEG